MHLKVFIGMVCSLWILFSSCEQSIDNNEEEQYSVEIPYASSKPGVRWWWFATEIKKEDVAYQLEWLKERNFGGVEIAWVYPLYRYQRMYERKYNRHYPKDTTAQEWLSEEWTDMLVYTKQYADSIGLYCDFTFGSAWPVASGNIDPSLGTKIYGDPDFRQTLTFSWAWPDTFLVIDHLDSNAFKAFAEPLADALQPALRGSKSALFTDSWEIKLNATNKVWTDGFEEHFEKNFGYDIIPYMEDGLDSFPDVRYDYMMQLGEMVSKGFYRPYVQKAKELGAWSRVQCLASPTDVMTTYSMVDIPETESMLNNPNYSRIVSSAAALSSKEIVSSESFTCMYGFPATYLRQEQIADLKMVADAMFANGVNHHFYHGFPYNPKGIDSIDFFATTYFGPGGSLEPDLQSFNQYIEKVSSIMRRGKTYSDVAVYIPYEDGIMKGAYPPERQRVWVWGEYELRYVDPPKELEGYHPLWINRHFLEEAKLKDGLLEVNEMAFKTLYVDVKYLDVRSLRKIYELSVKGLKVCLKSNPTQPGKVKDPHYDSLLTALRSLPNVSQEFEQVHPHKPIISGDSVPAYWCRKDEEGNYFLFLAQWKSKDLSYPVYSGQSKMDSSSIHEFEVTVGEKTIELEVKFEPYQSILLKIDKNGRVEPMDIYYLPKDPIVRPKEKQKMYF